MKMFKDNYLSTKDSKTAQQAASKSARVMRTERGHNIEAIGARRIERNRKRSLKRKNSFCNNLQQLKRR